MTQGLKHLVLKVGSFFNSPENVDFENVLIVNPGFYIRREKVKIINTMTCAIILYESCIRVNKG